MIASDPNNDIALLEVKNFSLSDKINPFPIANIKKVNVGEKVYAVGFPDSSKFGLRPKITDGLLNSASGYQDDPRFFQVSIPIQPGNSGSPVINEQGQVVGIITKTVSRSSEHIYQNLNYALKINYVINLLISLPDSIVVPEDTVFTRKTDGVDIMNYARDAVVRVVTND